MTLENIINYFNLLKKEGGNEKGLNYKLEIARFLFNYDYFMFKIRIGLCFLGMIATSFIALDILWKYFQQGYYFYNMTYFIIFVLYGCLFVFSLSYFAYRKLTRELKTIRKMIEE